MFGRNDLKSDDFSLHYSGIDSKKYPRNSVKFHSGKALLQGYVYNASKTARGLILIAPGIEGGADSYLLETRYFVDHGWCVFAFDGTGSRESEGSGIRGLPQTKLDVRAALDYISSSKNLASYPVMLYGHSMGGYAATSVLKDDKHDISAVVCVSGFNSPLDVMYQRAKVSLGFYANIEYPFIALYEKMLFGKDANGSAVDGINATDIPIMIVYGTADDIVPYKTTGIAAYKKLITNPDVIFEPVSAPYRNTHDTMQLSQAAAKYVLEKRAELADLHTKYGSVLPTSVWDKFYKSIDRSRINEIDTGYLQMVTNFYQKSLNDKRN